MNCSCNLFEYFSRFSDKAIKDSLISFPALSVLAKTDSKLLIPSPISWFNKEIYLYQLGKLYFYAEKPFLPPSELYYKKDKDSIPLHIKVNDYVIKLSDGLHIMDEATFRVMFNEV